MVLIAQFAEVGAALLLLCQLAVAIPCVLIVIALMATSAERRYHPKYWWALGCIAQAIPVALLLGRRIPFFVQFEAIWMASMALVPIGFVVIAAWPERGQP